MRDTLTADDKAISLMHEPHLQAYWPIFGLGSIAEVAGYLFFHPDLFTLVVCMKTTGCLALWLSRRADGSKVGTGDHSNRFWRLGAGLTTDRVAWRRTSSGTHTPYQRMGWATDSSPTRPGFPRR